MKHSSIFSTSHQLIFLVLLFILHCCVSKLWYAYITAETNCKILDRAWCFCKYFKKFWFLECISCILQIFTDFKVPTFQLHQISMTTVGERYQTRKIRLLLFKSHIFCGFFHNLIVHFISMVHLSLSSNFKNIKSTYK